jgi:hypothetical protein
VNEDLARLIRPDDDEVMKDDWLAWEERLRRAKDTEFELPAEIECVRLDQRARPTQGRTLLAAGTRVRYAETTYDGMRLDEALHAVKVVSGPLTGAWAGIPDIVGPDPLPWEPGSAS